MTWRRSDVELRSMAARGFGQHEIKESGENLKIRGRQSGEGGGDRAARIEIPGIR